MLDPTEEGIVVDRFEYPVGVETVVHQSAGRNEREISNLQLEDNTKPIASFGDPDWPPKISILQHSLTNPTFSATLVDVEDELIFPST